MIYYSFTYMARLETNETKLTLAVSRSNSLRTTVPMNIVKKLGLSEGDHVTWDMDKINNEWIAIIRKKE